MKVLDPGHCYELAAIDAPRRYRSILQFVKREGDKYPGNVGHGPGVQSQEVIRVLIDRAIYVHAQVPNWQTRGVLLLLKGAIFLLEHRAAKRNKIPFPWLSGWKFGIAGEVCVQCGHVVCRHFQLPTDPVFLTPEQIAKGAVIDSQFEDVATPALIEAKTAIDEWKADPAHPRCKAGMYCGQEAGHAGECDDIPF